MIPEVSYVSKGQDLLDDLQGVFADHIRMALDEVAPHIRFLADQRGQLLLGGRASHGRVEVTEMIWNAYSSPTPVYQWIPDLYTPQMNMDPQNHRVGLPNMVFQPPRVFLLRHGARLRVRKSFVPTKRSKNPKSSMSEPKRTIVCHKIQPIRNKDAMRWRPSQVGWSSSLIVARSYYSRNKGHRY